MLGATTTWCGTRMTGAACNRAYASTCTPTLDQASQRRRTAAREAHVAPPPSPLALGAREADTGALTAVTPLRTLRLPRTTALRRHRQWRRQRTVEDEEEGYSPRSCAGGACHGSGSTAACMARIVWCAFRRRRRPWPTQRTQPPSPSLRRHSAAAMVFSP